MDMMKKVLKILGIVALVLMVLLAAFLLMPSIRIGKR